MRINRNFGFTVAEVLIAIGVVGVLTLLLVSVFRSNDSAAWQKSKDYKLGIVKYDKVYNAINYSFNQQLMKNNNVSNLNGILGNALNTLNTTCTGASCAASVSGDKGVYNTRISDLSRKLADNSELTVYSKSTGGATEYAVFVDTNGKEKPNTIGKDILPIYIDKDGNVINVNPKTGKKFDKVIQKKYDSNKKFTFKCPNEDIVLTLAKDAKTGLYTDINGRKCNKICKVDYAQKVYGHYLSDVKPVSYDATSKKLIYDGDSYLKYFATYAPLTCFSNPDHSCKKAGALYYFKEKMKSLYGSEGADHIVDETNKIVTAYDSANKYVEYKASYNKDCEPVFDPNYPKCTNAGIKAYFNSAFGTSLDPTINTSNKTVSATSADGYHFYSATYNYASCAISNTSTKGCSPTEAQQAFKNGLTAMGVTPGTLTTSTSGSSYTITYKKDSLTIYSATYTLGTSVNSCSATINTEIKSCDNGGTAISDLQGLKDINNNLSGTYCLVDDITVGSWSPLGNFKGVLDGQDHTLSNLSITLNANDYIGLFSKTEDATIKNLKFTNVNITGGKVSSKYIGSLAGYMKNTNVDNVHVLSGKVKGSSVFKIVGGLVGEFYSSKSNSSGIKLQNSSSAATVSGNSTVGGLVGEFNASSADGDTSKTMQLLNSSATGSVTGSNEKIGGLVGYVHRGYLNNTSASGSVSGVDKIGGLVGKIYCLCKIHNSYAVGTVTATGNYVGGLLGDADYVNIVNCYAKGSVSGKSYVGGLTGSLSKRSTDKLADSSYATGNVTATGDYVGGFSGNTNKSDEGQGTIINCYAIGSVSGKNYVGGFVGSNSDASIQGSNYTYSVGKVSATGLKLGKFAGNGSFINSTNPNKINGVNITKESDNKIEIKK